MAIKGARGAADASRVTQQRAEASAAAVAVTLPGLVAVLAVAEVLAAPLHALVLTGTPRVVMTTLSATSGLVLAVLCLALGRWPVPPRLAHPVALAVLAVVAAGPLTALHVLHSLTYTGILAVVLVVFGLLLLDLRWLAAGLAATWAVFLALLPATGGLGRAPALGALGAATLGAVVVAWVRGRDVTVAAVARRAADRAAAEDALTGLLNRRGLQIIGDRMLAQARRAGSALHCVYVDIDGLAEVNERLGYPVGDEVLVSVASTLAASVRSGDVVARWGGDEFAVLGAGPGTAAAELEDRVRARLQQGAPHVPGWVPHVSAGAAIFAPWDEGGLGDLIDRAGQEMVRRRAVRPRSPAPWDPAGGDRRRSGGTRR